MVRRRISTPGPEVHPIIRVHSGMPVDGTPRCRSRYAPAAIQVILLGRDRLTGAQAETAKSFCGECAVRGACLNEALGSIIPPQGVRGGLSEPEVLEIRNQRRNNNTSSPNPQ